MIHEGALYSVFFLYRPGESFDNTNQDDDLQRLYNRLEDWRLAEEKRLVTTSRSQEALRAGRAKLVADEALKLAQLANKRDKSMEVHKQDVIQNVIIKVSNKKPVQCSSSLDFLKVF